MAEILIEVIVESVIEILSFGFDGFMNKAVLFFKKIRGKRKGRRYTTLRP